ncbi:hypothetical protein ELI13_22370 [Rhizobium ruizarguesonis]|uniref:Uncharacterized protein n=1 Tax=Rhizobium ruizarguesonis TaxID=2081791 RepID=A0ABY1XG06_9HYPH|nr:hypothetical protein [Rhizobium ruizarguesonis]NEJ15278.1 hypothetical protein [Rhizobium ruizarguesonis]NEK29353.1 hypothetical protein [Rhizobium ruizarguesonis]TAU29004.1 hypothetical protein ELI48_24165 [Rhizobium ruizarguesonis]TAU50749.1 hypothetical protein ELI42_23210 [Rhizobium ruizarguesonis]TAU65821.1 hypothetical protein ELI44_23230 [Rhizobium ruizarguesonis]
MIEFATGPSPREVVESRTGHLVVCEQGHELSEVIAANYAYALGAGLVIVPNVPTDVADAILETFYSLYDHPDYSARELRQDLRARLRSFCGALSLPASPSLTFITNKLPFGFGYSEAPSTHLFTYPDLGMAIINGFASAASNKDETVAAVVVDPGQTPAPEIATAAELLAQRGTFVRGYRGPAANVRDVSQMIEHFPYDLLIIATHCGDAPGYRWTHEFKDAEGRTRQLVVDIALGIAQSEDDPDVVQLTRFERFHSLDGVLWNDPEKAKKIVVGSAIVEYMRQAHDTQELKPISKETINRVLGSAALRMYDNNLIALPTAALANYRTPIIFNNACVSWHELSKRFMFANAKAYIGTLWPVTGVEAEDVLLRTIGKHFGKPLAHALWSAQREAYQDQLRHPYIMTGVYPQWLRGSRSDGPHEILKSLAEGLGVWQGRLSKADGGDEQRLRSLKSICRFFQVEYEHMKKRWPRKEP